MLTPRRTLARRGLAAAVVAGGLIAVGSAAADDPPAPRSVAPDAAQPAAISAIQPGQADALRVFRRAARPSDALPAAARPAAGPDRFGRNPDLARAIRTANGTGWVVPGDGVVCLVAPDAVDGYATTCAPTDVVRTDGLTLGQGDDETTTATTLVPDDATVVLQADDGTRTRVVPDNSGATRVDATDADHLEVVTDEGRSATPLLDAADAARAGNG